MAADRIEIGTWVVTIYKAYAGYDLTDPSFEAYDAVIQAGKAAYLLSSIRRLGLVTPETFAVYRKLARLRPKECADVVRKLEAVGAVEVAWDLEGPLEVPIKQIRAVDQSDDATWQAIGRVFVEQLGPTAEARAAVEVLALTVRLPIDEGAVVGSLAQGFTERAVRRGIEHLLSFRILAQTSDKLAGSRVLFNPVAFRKNAQDAYEALKGLKGDQRAEALEIIDHVQRNPGVPFGKTYREKAVKLLVACGLIDVSAVLAKGGAVRKEFPTAPYVWNARNGTEVGQDTIDDSKLLLNSFRFGQYYSSPGRGRINDPLVLVSALIDRGRVGSASAIGEDYPLPLARGIVSIAESQIYPGRFDMLLLKEDVALAVRDVLTSGAISPKVPADEAVARPLSSTGEYLSPDFVRIQKQLPPDLAEARDALAFELRTYRKGR